MTASATPGNLSRDRCQNCSPAVAQPMRRHGGRSRPERFMSLARLLWAAVAAVAVATPLMAAPPAYACTPPGGGGCGDANLAVNLAAGTLSLSVPPSVSINGTLGSASSFSAAMGTVEVQGGGLLTGWTLTAATTGNLVRSGTPTTVISLGTSSSGGPLTISTGVITPVGISSLLNVTAGGGGSLNPSQPVTVARALAAAGGGTYDMAPTLTLTPPANTAAGTYTTTITFTLS